MRLALLCLVLLRVVIAAGMPHKYSAEKLGLRRQRALDFGFVHAVPKGHSVMYVPTDLKKRAAAQVRQLAVHRGRVLASATPWYKTSEAIQGTRAQFTTSENQKAQRIKKAADSAWHDWKDLVPSSLPSSSGAAKTSHSLPLSRVAAWADLADEDEFPLLKTSTLPSSSVSDTRSKVEETEACALIDLEEQMPTEEQMPNDSDRTTEAFDRGALPELAGKLKQRRAAIGEAVDIGCTSFDFGHLQTFYLPRAHVDGVRETQKLEDRIVALEKNIEDATQAKNDLAAQLQVQSQQFLSAVQEKDMQILQLQAHISSFSRDGNFVSFSCDGNGSSLNGGFGFAFSCDGNGSQNFSHGNYSTFVPLHALSDGTSGPLPQCEGSNACEIPAPAEESASRLDELFQGLHELRADFHRLCHRFQESEKSHEAKDFGAFDQQKEFQELHALKEEVRVEWRSRLEGIQVAFQCKLDALDHRLEANDAFEEQFETCLKTHLFDDRLLELSRKLQECRCRLHSLEEDRIPTLEAGFNSAVCRQPQCNSDSDELKLRIKRLEDLVPPAASSQLQCSTDSEFLLRIVRLEERIAELEVAERAGIQEVRADHGQASRRTPSLAGVVRIDSGGDGGSAGLEEKSQPCTSDLFARFAALQNKKKKDSEEASEEKADKKKDKIDKFEDTMVVDMGTYVSNSIHIDPERDEATSFRQRRMSAVSITDSEEGLSETQSQIFARQMLENGYDPEHEVHGSDGMDSDFYENEYETDGEYGESYSNEPWA